MPLSILRLLQFLTLASFQSSIRKAHFGIHRIYHLYRDLQKAANTIKIKCLLVCKFWWDDKMWGNRTHRTSGERNWYPMGQKGKLRMKLTTCFLSLLTVYPCDFNSSEKSNTCQTAFHTTDKKFFIPFFGC